MGRKNKNKKSVQSGGTKESPVVLKEFSVAAKKELMDLIKILLEKCSQPSCAGAKEFEDYLDIRNAVEKIREIQSSIAQPAEGREGKFSLFLEWLQVNKVDTSSVQIHNFAGYGFGLQAAKDLKEGEKFLSIPRDLMMTPASASESALGPLIAEDKILQVMPSIVLALHLLVEKRTPSSKWKPYIDILPDTFGTPLYFTPEELPFLQGSPVHADCISQYRNIARQYAYFYRLFNSSSASHNLPIKDSFTYDDYRWAVSAVMTRQNLIPTQDGSKMTYALIPLWDMCNHCNGLITTDFNLDNDCSDCNSLRNYSKGDQILIFYGPRSNGELLVNNGFVYPENEHDRMAIKLGISKSNPLFNLQSELLTRCGIQSSRTFYLHTGDFPVDGDLLFFLRIFHLDEDMLKEKISAANASEIHEELGNLDKTVSINVDTKVWSYLETRAALLLKAYNTSIEEDEDLLQKGKHSPLQSLCIQLRMCEKKILRATVSYSLEKWQSLKAAESTQSLQESESAQILQASESAQNLQTSESTQNIQTSDCV